MKYTNPIALTLTLTVYGLCAMRVAPAFAQQEINITEYLDATGFPKPIPVNISGFTGEADTVLKNDLLFMGMANVGPDQAKYLITGSNADRVEGRVIEKINKHSLLAKAYTGGKLRAQVHALADDIAQVITGKPGIAQTKVAFKVETGRPASTGGRVSEVYIADYDGHNPIAVTQDNSTVAAPCWAGRDALYYGSYKGRGIQVYFHRLTTGERRAVTRFPGSNMSPAVSPDGRKLAMILSKSGSPDLYVSDLDGSNLKQLTATREAESSPCWSPDSRSICYVSRDRGPASLYVVAAAGGTPRRLATSGVPNATEPDWSPDGKWIIFTAMFRDFQLCLVPATGGTAMTIVAGEDPSWAPNSRAVIFCRGPDHAKSLSLLDVPTKQVKTIARFSESNSQPSWAK